jgi:hypothetical protein
MIHPGFVMGPLPNQREIDIAVRQVDRRPRPFDPFHAERPGVKLDEPFAVGGDYCQVTNARHRNNLPAKFAAPRRFFKSSENNSSKL